MRKQLTTESFVRTNHDGYHLIIEFIESSHLLSLIMDIKQAERYVNETVVLPQLQILILFCEINVILLC